VPHATLELSRWCRAGPGDGCSSVLGPKRAPLSHGAPGLEGDGAAMPTAGDGELGNSSILAMVSSAGQGCALGAEAARAAVTGVDGV